MSSPPAYLPAEFVNELEDVLTRDRSTDDPLNLWPLERLLESVFADGYRQGHLRGYSAGRGVARRRAEEASKSDGATS